MRGLLSMLVIGMTAFWLTPLNSVAADTTSAAAARPSAAVIGFFAKPVALRGTLGDVAVQVRLRVKEDFAEGLEGEYFRFGRSQKILLAGEMDTDGMFIEESENGTDISGQWEGKIEGDTIRGTWTSADGDITKPFVLNVLRPPAPSKAIPAKSRNVEMR